MSYLDNTCICPNCNMIFPMTPLSVEPLFTIDEVARMTGRLPNTVRRFLSDHQEVPRRYRITRNHRRYRLLTTSEIRYIRDHVVKEYVQYSDGTQRLKALVDVNPRYMYPTIDWTKQKPRAAPREARAYQTMERKKRKDAT